MLIDESDRTFKRGVIITATVVRILEKKVLCKLDNGLDGIIFKEDICNENEDLEKIIQTGHVITGRIDKISNEEDSEKKRFSVTLKCKRSSLERHDEYVDRNVVHPDDLVNHNF
jgi:ribosomal protein S1